MTVRLNFQVVDCSSEDDGYKAANLLDIGPQSKGWLSSKYSIYPQHLILQLPSPAIVQQMQILGNAWAVATELEIHLGEVPKKTTRDKKNALFMKLGTLSNESSRDFDFKARQLMSVEVENGGKSLPVSFIKLVLYKNFQNKKNQYNQVGLTAINILGTYENDNATQVDEFNLDEVLSPYDELSFLVYTDSDVVQLIQKLEKRKNEAVSMERFEYVKRLKDTIETLVESGGKLGTMQMQKQKLVEKQDYEGAKEKKNEMEEYRVEVYKNLDLEDILGDTGSETRNP